MSTPGHHFLKTIWQALGGAPDALDRVRFTGAGSLPSVFAVSDLAVASVAAAGLALAELAGADGVVADRRLSSAWFGYALRPQGWDLPPAWDAVAGDYRAADGWIRLHTNAPHHRAAALSVLGVLAERAAVARA
ncbi:acyl-CoA transferase, partial [Nitrospirillum amazonense]|nr:acyl-CoA transferase [Nitrospirillum amazonense]